MSDQEQKQQQQSTNISPQPDELSEEELKMVSGGGVSPQPIIITKPVDVSSPKLFL